MWLMDSKGTQIQHNQEHDEVHGPIVGTSNSMDIHSPSSQQLHVHNHSKFPNWNRDTKVMRVQSKDSLTLRMIT